MKQLVPYTLLMLLFPNCEKAFIEQPTELAFCLYPAYKEATFRDGMDAWTQYLQNNLEYPQSAIDSHITGTVVVKFVVLANGSVAGVEAVSGPQELRESAIAVIKNSPPWINESGRDCHKQQPIIFRFDEK